MKRNLQLFAVRDGDPAFEVLAVPEGAGTFEALYEGAALGVYSALRTFEHHKFLRLEAHLARTERSMALLGWDYALNHGRLRRALHEVCMASPWPEARVRFDVLAAPAVHLGTESRELIALMPFTPPPAQLYEEGVAVDFAPDLARPRPLAKTADFSMARRAYPVGGADAYEYLLLDAGGHILEGTGTNFYAVRDGVIWTAGEGVLEGVTRQIILELIAELRMPLRLEAVHVDDLPHLEEAALSGSSRAVLPVVKVAGQRVGDSRPGPVVRRLLGAYWRYVGANVRTAVEL